MFPLRLNPPHVRSQALIDFCHSIVQTLLPVGMKRLPFVIPFLAPLLCLLAQVVRELEGSVSFLPYLLRLLPYALRFLGRKLPLLLHLVCRFGSLGGGICERSLQFSDAAA